MEKDRIIKALECCVTKHHENCCNLGKWSEEWNCMTDLMKNALELIKQQDEQIFQLENRLKECENGYTGTLHLESCKLHDAEERVKQLTEEVENWRIDAENYRIERDAIRAEVSVKKKLLDKCVDLEDRVRADTVREIFTEIYSSLDYIEEQMEPDEIPECFFSVREDIDVLKVRFEGEGNSQASGGKENNAIHKAKNDR